MTNEGEKWTKTVEPFDLKMEKVIEEEYTPHYDIESTLRAKQLEKKYSSNNLAGYAGKYENLVSSADGVGTKILLAQYARASFNRPLNSIGQDVVAMVVNDLICKGAVPLFFLDYFASSKISNAEFHEVLDGIHEACSSINIPLLGGETAKLPGIVHSGTFDVAGFGVGKIESVEDELPSNIQIGDVVIGIKSTGFHSNGFTIIRRNIGWRESGNDPFLDKLLTPTKIYVEDIQHLKSIYRPDPLIRWVEKSTDPTIEKTNRESIEIKGLAHITGGGFDNINRILPKKHTIKYDDSFLYENDYPAHADMFRWIQENEGLTTEQMYNTFNCGVGMAVILSPEDADILNNHMENVVETNNVHKNYNYSPSNYVQVGHVQHTPQRYIGSL